MTQPLLLPLNHTLLKFAVLGSVPCSSMSKIKKSAQAAAYVLRGG